MKHHCRCKSCGRRKKLAKHPLEYLRQPMCWCGAKDWRKDMYRHKVEIPQMRNRLGRYRVCYSDCFMFPHRYKCTGCKFEHD